MTDSKHTPGPWDYVPLTEHHGPYVTSEFGTTICDCYFMVDNGGRLRPIGYLHEMAEPNARLIATSPDLLEFVKRMYAQHGYEDAARLIARAEGRQDGD